MQTHQQHAAKVKLKVKAPQAAKTSADNSENDKKARSGAVFLGLVVIGYIVFLVLTGQMGEFLAALKSVDSHWILIASLAFVFYFIFGVIAYAIAVYLDHDSPVGVRDLMSVEASGIFFGNLTPMMAGSVPSQIYRLTKTGLDVGEASATQFTRFIMFQLAVVLFAAIMLVLKLDYFFETYGDIIILNLIVFGVHFIELAVLFAICLIPRWVQSVGGALLNFGTKLGVIKDRSHFDELLEHQVMEFHLAFKTAAKDLPSMLLTLVVTMAQLAALYMIPWFILKAFAIDADFLECLAAGSMVQMVASAVPLPGGTGGAEGGFLMFYGHMFKGASAAGFLLWRIVTFFGPTILAAPLLGLRSTSTRSIYERINRLKSSIVGRYTAFVEGTPKAARKSSKQLTLSAKQIEERAKAKQKATLAKPKSPEDKK